jgi:hypothetical protein
MSAGSSPSGNRYSSAPDVDFLVPTVEAINLGER